MPAKRDPTAGARTIEANAGRAFEWNGEFPFLAGDYRTLKRGSLYSEDALSELKGGIFLRSDCCECLWGRRQDDERGRYLLVRAAVTR